LRGCGLSQRRRENQKTDADEEGALHDLTDYIVACLR
jgi:hypothetical protein